MNEHVRQRLEALLTERVCGVCPDRNVDGSCDRLAEGSCTLMEKLPEAAEAVLMVDSDRIEPYIDSVRANVCAHCILSNEDGTCDQRSTDRCMLNSYFPIVVECIEEFFGRQFRPPESAQTAGLGNQ